jgi:hypothetical protein
MEVLMAEWANLVFHNIMVDGTAILLVCHVIANKMITRVIVNKKKYKICKTKKFFLKKKKKKTHQPMGAAMRHSSIGVTLQTTPSGGPKEARGGMSPTPMGY